MSEQRVLLVDYDPRSTDFMEQALTEAGFQVEIARDGLAGLESFRKIHPALTIIEAMIPKKHGFEICEEIKALPEGPQSPVIITSASFRGRRARDEAMRLYHADEYLEKPITGEQLIDVCRRLLGQLEGPETTGQSETPREVDIPRLDELNEAQLIAQLDGLIPTDSTPSSDEERPAQETEETAPSSPLFPSTDEALLAATETLIEEDEGERAGEESSSERDIDEQLDEILAGEPAAEPEMAAEPEPSNAPAKEETPVAVNRPQPAVAPPPVSPPAPVPQIAKKVDAAQTESLAVTRAVTTTSGIETETTDLVPKEGGRRWILPVVVLAAGLTVAAIWMIGGFGSTPTSPTAKTAVRPATRQASDRPVLPRAALPVGPSTVPVTTAPDAANAVPEPLTETPKETPKPIVVAKPKTPGTESRPVVQPPAVEEKTPSPAVERPEPAASVVATRTPGPRPATSTGPVAVQGSPEPVAPTESDLKTEATTEHSAEETSSTKDPVSAEKQGPVLPPATPAPSIVDSPAESLLSESPAGSEPAPSSPNWTIGKPREPVVAEPAPSRARRGDLVPLDEVDALPVAIRQGLPPYPEMARRMKQEGTVHLELLIDESGAVIDSRQTSGDAGPHLTKAALSAVRKWTFEPARKDGVAVQVWKPAHIEFKP